VERSKQEKEEIIMDRHIINKNDFLYCGLKKEEYESIEDRIMERNVNLTSKVSVGIAALGVLFFAINAVVGNRNLLAYWILMIGGIIMTILKPFATKSSLHTHFYCYFLIVVVFAYGIVLSFQPGNINKPSTSIVVFLALMPLVINDKPARMGMVIFASTALYLILAFFIKSSAAFSTDIMNTITFSVLGYFLYLGISNRNVKEIFYGIQATENEKLKEKARVSEQSNRAKSNFLANMSHEIRTPMNAIIGMDEMILRDCHDIRIRKYALDIQSAGRTLLSIINDILDLSKIESGKMEIVAVEYDFASVLNDVVNMTMGKAQEKGLEYKLIVDPEIPAELKGDEIRIRQIILNITNNAIKYTQEGSVGIRFSFDRAGSKLKCEVTDTGMGIKDEDMDKLFTSFQRLDETKNRNVEGTGLGLNITRQLCEMMGGSVSVLSTYGQGSTFIAEVVQEVVDATPIGNYTDRLILAQEDMEEYKPALIAPDAKVLIVDDNEMNLEVITELMRDTKIKVTTATSGVECIEILKSSRFDVIFLDQMMPGMSGTQTLEKINEQKLAGNTPVIALTADAIAGAKETYIREGFSDYLSKPVMYSELESTLLKYIDKALLKSQEEIKELVPRPVLLIWGEDSTAVKAEKERLENIYKCICAVGENARDKYLEKHEVDAVMKV